MNEDNKITITPINAPFSISKTSMAAKQIKVQP